MNKPNQLSLFSDEEMGVQPGYIKPGNRQPTYPVQRLGTYIRKSDGILCYYPVASKPFEVYVQQARAIWGDRYDYSNSVYTNNKAPINIYCPKHDYEFRVAMAQNHIMKANKHFKPTACPICQYEKQYGKEYGPDWRNYLRLCAKRNRVGLINKEYKKPIKTTEQIEAENRAKEEHRLEKQRQEQAMIDKYGAKSYKEAKFIKKLIAKYGDIYGREFLDYQDRDIPVTLVCPEHGPFKIKPRTLLTGDNKHKTHGCWRCSGLVPPEEKPKPMTADEFFAKMRELYGDKYDFSKSEYKSTNHPVKYYCREHNWQKNSPKSLLSGYGCDYCAGRKFWWPDFERLAREKHGDKYDYSQVVPQENKKGYVTIICPDHGPFKQRADLHLLGYGCRECVNYPNKKSAEQRCKEWTEKIHKKYGENRFDLSEVHYVNNDTHIWVTCNLHHHRYQTTPDTLLRGAGGCPYCTASEGEAIIYGWLENHGIRFQHNEVQVPNTNPNLPLLYLVPDFWLPDYNMFIEFNGTQHYENIPHFYDNNRLRTFEVQQERDRTLRKYCDDKKINLLEIPFADIKKIPKILKKALKVKT